MTLDSTVEMYDANSIDSLIWPQNPQGEYAKKFLTPLIKNGLHHYIDNVHATLYALKIDSFVVPVVLVHPHLQNSYVCSPYSHYISFGKQYSGIIENRYLSSGIKSLVNGMGHICNFGKIDAIVYVNNWLFSTDLYQPLSTASLNAITEFLKKRFPEHTIALRSLNPTTNASLKNSLKTCDFDQIVSRYVYLTDTQEASLFQTRIIKSDLKLHRETKLEIVDENKILLEDCPQLLKLYKSLYIKHSSLQPQFNLSYIQLLYKKGLLRFKAIKQNGEIIGVAGYYERENILMCPFFGLDKSDLQHNIVYRLLNTELLLEAQKRQLIFHQSAGASTYKKIRRAKGCLETMAIYTKHLPYKQKITWAVLKSFMNKIAPKYMEKY